MLAAWEHSILQCWNYVSPCAAVGLAAQLHMEVTWPWLATDSRGLVDDRSSEQAQQVDAGWQGTTAACAPEKYTRWIDSLADMGRYSEIESPPGQETRLSPVFSPCLPSVMPLAHDEVHCELLYSSRCTDKRVTFESKVSFWFPASDQICLPGKDRFFLPKQGRPPRGILKSSCFLPAAKHSLLHSTRESVFPRSLEVEVCLDVPDVQMDPVSNTDAVAVHCLPAEADVDDDTVPHASVSLACLQRLGKSVDEALACGLGHTPCTGFFPQGTTCPAGGPAAAAESGARHVEASAFSSGSSPAKPLHTPDTPFLPIERATVSSSSGTHAADWFIMFGTVEGHQVLRKLPDWSDFRCITEAIAHAAPALLRPSGSTLVAPLPGLFVPQVVLTRQVPNTGFKTIVCDLRAIGADIRVEDIRVGRSVASVTEGEGALVHLLASLRVRSHDLSFVVNHQAVLPGFMLDQHSESIILSWRPRAGEAAEAPTRACPAASNEGETRQASFDVSGSSRWGSGSSWDHRVYRPLRPPTPPLPPDAMPNVAAMDRAILGGLQFTVFDEHHHRRTLPRHEGQGVLDLVELALSLTPEIHRPWGHRVLTQEWPDWPSPQLVIWGPLNDGHRVIPIRNLDSPEAVCTVSVPEDACPFAAMVAAERACPPYATFRLQVARSVCSFLADHRACPPFEPGPLRMADIAEVQTAGPIHAPRGYATSRWQPRLPTELTIAAPRSSEDLWPVTEVVVHFRDRAPQRFQLPFGQDVAVLRVQLCHDMHLPATSVFRLPSHCPVERGSPLHLYLHVPSVSDPWNDPEDAPEQSWGLVDMRRCVGTAGVDYVMLLVPSMFDLAWLRERIHALFPDLPTVHAAYMGVTPLHGHQSPDGHTPLLTVFPRSQHTGRDFGHMYEVLDTQQLTALRGGCARMVGAHFPRRNPVEVPTTADGSGCMRNNVASRGYPAISPMILQTVPDEDADVYEPDEVMVFSSVRPPSFCVVPAHFPPAEFHASLARHVGLDGHCTMHIPMLAPLQPGHPRVAVVLPSNMALDRKFVLVDARRVCPAGAETIWLQEAPQVLNPVIVIAMVRRAQPALREMGAFYLDSAPLRGYADLTARVTILTLMPATFSFDRLPVLLQNSRMLRRRIGFLQHHCRFANRARYTARDTPTTTTTTAMQTNANRGAGAVSIYDKLVRFFVASPRGHCESGTLHGSLPVEDVLAQLCVQLADAHELAAGLTICASDRIVSDFDHGFSVFVNVHDPSRCEFAWVDARRFGQEPFTVALPFILTMETLAGVCPVSIPQNAHIAISGAPWKGLPYSLRHGDVIVVGFRKHHLWTIPLFPWRGELKGSLPSLCRMAARGLGPESLHFRMRHAQVRVVKCTALRPCTHSGPVDAWNGKTSLAPPESQGLITSDASSSQVTSLPFLSLRQSE